MEPANNFSKAKFNFIFNNNRQPSELAQEIISRQPDFFEKWALYIFILFLSIMVGATWFVKYPDIIIGQGTLTAINAPKQLVPKLDGHLTRLFVKNNDRVKRNDIIGWIESTADQTEVLTVSKTIKKATLLVDKDQTEQVPMLFSQPLNNLGELQQDYHDFIIAVEQYNLYRKNGFYAKKRNILSEDLHSLKQSKVTLQDQEGLTKEDVKLADESFQMNRKLYDEKVMTSEEYRQQQSKLLNKQMSLPQLNSALLSNESQQRDKLKEIDQLDQDQLQEKNTFEQALRVFKSQVDDWLHMHVLTAPVDGNVNFTVPLQENQFIHAGQVLGYINPVSENYYIETYLPQKNFGKIQKGLNVQLRFNAYPYEEFGYVDGKLNYISSIPADSGFLATIKLTNGLKTNYKKHIFYKNGLKVQAVIITRNSRLSDRLFYAITKLVSINTGN